MARAASQQSPTAAATACQLSGARSSCVKLTRFKWCNTALRNLKTSLAGASHALNDRTCAGQYLCAFASHLNHRFGARGRVARAISNVRRSRVTKKKGLRIHAETSF